MIKMGYIKPSHAHSRHGGIESRMGRLLMRYHEKFKFLETKHLMHKDNKGDLATLIDQYRQAMELLQAIVIRDQKLKREAELSPTPIEGESRE